MVQIRYCQSLAPVHSIPRVHYQEGKEKRGMGEGTHIYEVSMCTRHCAKYFINIKSLDSHNNPRR